MYAHHTKNKGDLGVLKVKLDLFDQGYLILNPETEHAPFDLVAYKDQTFKRIQVKYRALTRGGVLDISFRTSYSFSGGVVTRSIDKEEIDLFAIYCPETDGCYYLQPKDFDQTVSLRVKAPRNGQCAGVRWAKDFRKVP